MNTITASAVIDTRQPAGWRWAPAWVLAYVAAWPVAPLSEAILSLGALTALFLLLRARFASGQHLLGRGAWALSTALFFAYWLPQLFSAPDALDPATLGHTLAGLRCLPFMWLAAGAVASERGRHTVFAGIALIVLVWALDVLLQGASAGRINFLNGALDALYPGGQGQTRCEVWLLRGEDGFDGVFGSCNPVLGIVLASCSPFVLFAAAQRFARAGWLVAAVLMGMAIFFSGLGAAGVGYALVLLCSGWQVWGGKRLLLALAGCAVVMTALALSVPQVGVHFARAAMLPQGGATAADAALAGSGRIWGAAACMVENHPLNGVGARNFRYAFADCDPARQILCMGENCPMPAEQWNESTALHAHQLIYEILSETGFLGLVLWLAGAVLAWRAWRVADAACRERARPAMLALAATVFPFNPHPAFHAPFWGGVFLLWAALYAGSLLAREAVPDTSDVDKNPPG